MSTHDYDLMVANSDARNLTLTHNTAPVPLNFRHACAAVSFVFQKGSQASHVDYYIEDFELKYLLSVGSLVFTSTDQSASLDDQWCAPHLRSVLNIIRIVLTRSLQDARAGQCPFEY